MFSRDGRLRRRCIPCTRAAGAVLVPVTAAHGLPVLEAGSQASRVTASAGNNTLAAKQAQSDVLRRGPRCKRLGLSGCRGLCKWPCPSE